MRRVHPLHHLHNHLGKPLLVTPPLEREDGIAVAGRHKADRPAKHLGIHLGDAVECERCRACQGVGAAHVAGPICEDGGSNLPHIRGEDRVDEGVRVEGVVKGRGLANVRGVREVEVHGDLGLQEAVRDGDDLPHLVLGVPGQVPKDGGGWVGGREVAQSQDEPHPSQLSTPQDVMDYQLALLQTRGNDEERVDSLLEKRARKEKRC